jgi:16S rRNA G527 N7-methylase RsmG
MTDTQNTITTSVAFEDFLKAKADGLTRRALRNYREVLDLLVEFLDDNGIETITEGPAGAAGIAEILELVDEFNDDYLVSTINAERDFLRTAGQVSRDLSRWLKNLTSTRRVARAAPVARAQA